MLFDLQSPRRRRVVRVVFGTLAAIFGISFIFFGVGSGISGFDGSNGILDAIGIGGDDSANTGFEDEIDDAEKALEENPNDAQAMADLISLRYQAGTQLVEQDPDTGQVTVPSDAEDEMQQATETWQRYVKTPAGAKDSSAAGVAYQAYELLAQDAISEAQQATSTGEALTKAGAAVASWKGAAQARELSVRSQPTAAAYIRVVQLLYLAGDDKGAQAAAQKARAAATPEEAKQLDKALAAAEKQGKQFNEAIAKIRKQDQKQQEQFGGDQGNPLGDVGGGGPLGGGGTTGLGGGTTITP
jgi:hypothetical protein